MDRITSERIRSAEQHAQTLLKSLEQLKEGSVGTLLSNELKRQSLPRRAKDYKKDRRGSGDAVNDKPICSLCGNPTSSCKCSMMNSSPGKRRSSRREKSTTKTYCYESGEDSPDQDSSEGEEDIPLVTLRKRRRTTDEGTTNNNPRDGSGSSDDEWTPFGSSKKRKDKRRKGDDVNPSFVTQSTNSTSLRVPAINQNHISSSQSHSASYLSMPSLHSTRPALSSSRSSIPSSRHSSFPSNPMKVLPSSRDQHLLARLWHHPSEQVIRLQGSSNIYTSNKVATSFVPLSGYDSRSPSNCEKRSPSRDKRPLAIDKRTSDDNVKCSPEKSKEKQQDCTLLMFYTRFPRSQYCDQKRIIDLFRPYCSLSYIQWIDKRSALVTISDDSTFHTYDTIYINLMMRSDYDNDNLLYVGSYEDYLKRQESLNNKKVNM